MHSCLVGSINRQPDESAGGSRLRRRSRGLRGSERESVHIARLASRRQFPNHVYEHLARPTWMRSFPHLDETVPPIQPQIPLHLLVRVKPNFVQAKLDRSFIGEIEQSSSISFSLRLRAHSDAVN